ncbi:hypothetical protein DesLBE_2639 [Desulfitobacterium sp. LBE]|nr:hypothetical protein DesLBE_2639 [Desulfitobacterium sp. LBE]
MDVTLENPILGAEGVRLEFLGLISQAKEQRICAQVLLGLFARIQSQTICLWFDSFICQQTMHQEECSAWNGFLI